ncbi:MAG: hypothetical protein E7594_00850 [Ruminococcaceae bacterium]|nr:hypothetical protein [Oscillospiraceae bacterium]
MKKLTAMIFSIVIIMTAVCITAFPAMAASEGDWTTSRSPHDDDTYYIPAAGYHYTEEGFVTISPDYPEYDGSYQHIHTKNAVDLKANNDQNGNSVSLKFTILEYAYSGVNQNKDQWIAITLNSELVAWPGSLDYGEGICILFRRNTMGNELGEGKARIEAYYVDKEEKAFSTVNALNDYPIINVEMDEHGREVYTFTVSYNEQGQYQFNVAGYEFHDDYQDTLLDRVCADGAYVGITVQTGEAQSPISLCINEWQGKLPTGDDQKDPEVAMELPTPAETEWPEPTTEEMTTAPEPDTTWRETETADIEYDTEYATEIHISTDWIEQEPMTDQGYVIDHDEQNLFGNRGLIAELFGGCRSEIAIPAIAMITMIAAVITFKKKG